MMIRFIKLRDAGREPTKATEGATGYDLYAAIGYQINPGDFASVRTGIAIDPTTLPENLDMQVRPRSGLAAKHGVTVLNTPGTIDNDYTGEIKVVLINHGTDPFVITPGDRVGQLVFGYAFKDISFEEVTEFLSDTVRGAGGFGSSGR